MLAQFSTTPKMRDRSRIPLVVAFALVATLTSAVPAEAGAVRSAFAVNTLARNDDLSTGLVNIGININFFGSVYSQLYVNNNGNVTFDGPLSTFTPFPLLTTNRVIIAPFFADVDTRGPGDPVTYGAGTVDGRDAFGVNYVNVGHFAASGPQNSFQLVLIDRSDVAAGDFDIEFNYDQIVWEAGTASGSNGAGLGGFAARAGYSNGTDTAFELAGSAINSAFLDSGPSSTSLINNSLNSSVLGRYIFNVRNGQVVNPPATVPEPATLAIFGIGTLGALVRGRRQKQCQST